MDYPDGRPATTRLYAPEDGLEVQRAGLEGPGEQGGPPPNLLAQLPHSFWHFLRPRDPAGSEALRNLSREQAAALLEVVFEGDDGGSSAAERDSPSMMAVHDRVREVLPAVSSAALLKGIVDQVARTLRLQGRLGHLNESAGTGQRDGWARAAVIAPSWEGAQRPERGRESLGRGQEQHGRDTPVPATDRPPRVRHVDDGEARDCLGRLAEGGTGLGRLTRHLEALSSFFDEER